jgi:hypothetical protein
LEGFWGAPRKTKKYTPNSTSHVRREKEQKEKKNKRDEKEEKK